MGLANQEYPLIYHVGWLKRSYAYHVDDGRKYKWKEVQDGTNEGELYGPSCATGDTVGCGLNLQTRELYFTKNGVHLGIAYSNVYGILFPTVALSGPGSSITANFYPPFKYNIPESLTRHPPDSDSPILNPSSKENAPPSRELQAPKLPSAPVLSARLSSSGGVPPVGNYWRKCGKSIKIKDEITATLGKSGCGLAQVNSRCSTAQRVWYFEVYFDVSGWQEIN